MAETGGDELEAVKNYFNTDGYSRWKKIYGETDDVNKARTHGQGRAGSWGGGCMVGAAPSVWREGEGVRGSGGSCVGSTEG
jgi:hypothetical protein